MNLFIWPLVFILVLGSAVFLLSPSCVERVSMGVFLLLVLVLISLMESSLTPKCPESSIIANLISFGLVLITLSVCMSTLIISVEKENFLMIRKTPEWLKKVSAYIYSVVNLNGLSIFSCKIS